MDGVPDVSAVRGRVRARDHLPRRRRAAHPRRPRRRVQPRLHLSEGLDAEAAPRGSRPAPVAAGPARRRARRGRRGTRRSPRSSAASCRSSRSTAARRSPPTSATRTPTTWRAAVLAARCCAPSARRTCSRRAPSTNARRRSRARLMFGGALTVPVPDIDRTDYCLMLGANPYESNGSLATAPDWPGRIEALMRTRRHARRRRPAPDARPRRPRRSTCRSGRAPTPYLLIAMVHVLFADGLVDCGDVAEYVNGLDEVAACAAPFTPEAVEHVTGVPAARARASSRTDSRPRRPRACTAASARRTAVFGTLTSWLIDVLNVCTGNLDRPGGAMFTKAAAGAANARGVRGSGAACAASAPHARARAARRRSASCPSCAWPRRSTRRATGRSAR